MVVLLTSTTEVTPLSPRSVPVPLPMVILGGDDRLVFPHSLRAEIADASEGQLLERANAIFMVALEEVDRAPPNLV